MFVKLFSQLLDSTAWREPDNVLRVFLTLLLVCDREGFVRISIPGLADRARVTLSECEEAIGRLEGPDPYSQSPEEAGARIVRVGEPGEPLWHLVNYERYRAMKDQDQERERRRVKQARHRARKKAGSCMPPVYPMSTPCLPSVSPIGEGEGEGEEEKNNPPRRASTPRCRASSTGGGVDDSIIVEIIGDLNRVTGKKFRTTSKGTMRLIQARLAEGFTLDDFKKVHATKAAEWGTDQKMSKFLRPCTLYEGGKFEAYTNEREVAAPEEESPTANADNLTRDLETIQEARERWQGSLERRKGDAAGYLRVYMGQLWTQAPYPPEIGAALCELAGLLEVEAPC